VVISLPLAIAVSVVLARTLGPTEYARFAYLSFVVPLLLYLSELGVAQATVRAASQTFAGGDLEASRAILRKSFGWNLMRAPVACALVLAVAQPSLGLAIVVIVAIAISVLSGGLVYAIQAENRGAVFGKLGLVQSLAYSAVAIVAASLSPSGTTVWAITLLAGYVAMAPGLLFVSNPLLRRAALTPRFPRDLPEGFWRYGLSAVVLAMLSMLVFSRSEVVILHMLEREQALAVFALAFGLSQRLTTPVDTLLTPLVPALSALATAHPERFGPGFSRALRLSATAVAFLAAAAVVGTALAAPVLFGSEYAGTGAAFAALAGVSLLQSAAQPYFAVAHALGRLGVLVRANGIALVVDVVLAFALIPPLGVWGAVVANVAGGLVAIVLAVRALQVAWPLRQTGLLPARLIGVTASSVLAAYALGELAGRIDPVAGALTAFAAGAVSFIALGKVLGGLLPERDALVLLEALPPGVARLFRPLMPVVAESTPVAA
jgi:O-antigen/teichoic acid export membrane protein